MDLITEQQAKDLFATLTPHEQGLVANFLMQNIHQYKMSQINVDFPYFFYSIHKAMFDGEFPAQYIEPQITPAECSFLSIYYITKAVIKQRGGKK